MAGLCYLPVSMVIKVASENGDFLRTVKFGHFRNILTLTSNGWCCAGSFALGFNCGGIPRGFFSVLGGGRGAGVLCLSSTYPQCVCSQGVKPSERPVWIWTWACFGTPDHADALGNPTGSRQLACR